MSSSPNVNRLIKEKSPYLLQHAHNPVDWYPWGNEAFEKAKNEDKPIFLSIGYATCHWCHVMEEESFKSNEIAKLLNESFVNIKVDREELPEVDSIYMEFSQALMSSAGGWPLNVILTPDLKPFFAITYLPPKSRKGLLGFDQFIQHIKQLWQSEERHQLLEQADKIVDLFTRASQVVNDRLPNEAHISNSVEMLFELADPVYGGIKGEPKFPMGYQVSFLLEFARKKNDSRALFLLELTLDMMSRGGIYDHLGGGFSRYSVDERWSIPHFEKMLYDNAIIASTYLEAWKFTKKAEYREICEEILQYVLREMTDPQGGFYSAQDADSEGHEGMYYTWTTLEIQQALSKEDAELFCEFYGVSSAGNFEGRNVLHIATPLAEFSEMRKMPVDELRNRLSLAKKTLLKNREKRIAPFKDDKVLTSWNGLMISALIRAGTAFSNPAFREAALKAMGFIKETLWKDGLLLRRYREGEARFSAGLEDHAFLIRALITLFEEGCGTDWFEWALVLTDHLEKKFKEEKGAFYPTDGSQPLLLRKCEFYDGSEPSGNAVHAENLLRLFQITQDEKYLNQAEDIFKAAKNYIEMYPPGACYHLMALQRYLDVKAPTVVIALDELETLQDDIRKALSSHFCPHAEVIWKKKEDLKINSLLLAQADKSLIDGQTAVYVCRQNLCEHPLIEKGEILKAIQNL